MQGSAVARHLGAPPLRPSYPSRASWFLLTRLRDLACAHRQHAADGGQVAAGLRAPGVEGLLDGPAGPACRWAAWSATPSRIKAAVTSRRGDERRLADVAQRTACRALAAQPRGPGLQQLQQADVVVVRPVGEGPGRPAVLARQLDQEAAVRLHRQDLLRVADDARVLQSASNSSSLIPPHQPGSKP